jgi:hypothetical protein
MSKRKPTTVPHPEWNWERRRFTAAECLRGGIVRAAKLSKHRRQEIARMGYLAMLAKKAEKEATKDQKAS